MSARFSFRLHRRVFILCVAAAAFSFSHLTAQVDDAPPIVINSPDAASTFVYGSIKSHTLVWNKKAGALIAEVTFVDSDESGGSAREDTHDFHLPGVMLDEAKGTFYATSTKGEVIPVARYKKTLFIKSIETLPNARVRIQRLQGNVSVVLEALRPDDPALRAPGGNTRQIRFEDLFN